MGWHPKHPIVHWDCWVCLFEHPNTTYIHIGYFSTSSNYYKFVNLYGLATSEKNNKKNLLGQVSTHDPPMVGSARLYPVQIIINL